MSAEPAWYALVLAAGLSSRAGAFKPELPLAGRAVLHRVLDAFVPAVDGVFVVTGHESARVEKLLAEWVPPPCPAGHDNSRRAFRAQTVYNPGYAGEMMTSVLAGARAVPDGSYIFITPADYPLITPAVTRALRDFALEASGANDAPDVCIPQYNGRNGHPVLLAPESLAALRRVPARADTGASFTLKEFLAGRRRVYIEVDELGVLEDLDTPEDYARIKKMLRDKQ